MSSPKNPGPTSQEELSKRALKLKKDNHSDSTSYTTDKTSNPGMQKIEHVDQAPSGALDDVGDKPSRERSRERR